MTCFEAHHIADSLAFQVSHDDGLDTSGSDNSDKSENPAHGETNHTCDATVEGCDGYLSPLEKDVKEFAECVCDYLGIANELNNDSNNPEDFIEKLVVQQEKCDKIEEEFEEKYENADKTEQEEAELLMEKEMEDCEYL